MPPQSSSKKYRREKEPTGKVGAIISNEDEDFEEGSMNSYQLMKNKMG
jgi:hypothetical protein